MALILSDSCKTSSVYLNLQSYLRVHIQNSKIIKKPVTVDGVHSPLINLLEWYKLEVYRLKHELQGEKELSFFEMAEHIQDAIKLRD